MTAPSKPAVRVEAAFGFGYGMESVDWTDITAYVEANETIEIGRGRNDERQECDANTMQVTLNNRDGRFTPGYASGAYYPKVVKGVPIRVNAKWPENASFNQIADVNNQSFETSVAGWESNTGFGAYTASSFAQSSTRAHGTGTKSLLATWVTASSTWVNTWVTGLAIGRVYTASAWVYVPSGSPDVGIDVLFNATSAKTSTKNAWVRVSVTFTASTAFHAVGVYCNNATAGQQCWVDEVMVDEGSTLNAYTSATYDSVVYQRFRGFVDDWPVDWPGGTSFWSTVRITASSNLARMSRATLKAMVSGEYLRDKPTLYYPLAEPDGAVTAGDISDIGGNPPLAIAQAGSGGTLTFAGATGPRYDGQSSPNFARAQAGDGKYLSADVPSFGSNFFSPSFMVWVSEEYHYIECFFITPTTDSSIQQLVNVSDGGGQQLGLNMASSKVSAYVTLEDPDPDNGTRSVVVTSSNTYAPSAWHHAVACLERYDSTHCKLRLYMDAGAENITSGTHPVMATNPGGLQFPAWTHFDVGGKEFNWPLNGSIAHAAATVSAYAIANSRLDDHSNADLTGLSGENAGTRITRWAKQAGLPDSSLTNVDAGSPVAFQDSTGASATSLMHDAEKTDGGVLYDDPRGGLSYQQRTDRYTVTTPALTLSAAGQQIQDSLQAKMDDQFLINDITASRPEGLTIRVADQASLAAYGPYPEDIETLATTDEAVSDVANWRLGRYKEPAARISRVETELYQESDSPTVAATLGMDIGARLRITNLPAQAPAATVDSYVEGVSESIGASEWVVGFNLSPADLSTVWVLDDSVQSVLGTTTRLSY